MIASQTIDELDRLDLPQTTADELIARYIRQDPNRPGRHEARVVTGAASPQVWLLIPFIKTAGFDEVARSYALPREAVVAAVAYYQRNRPLIDAKILLDDESRAA